MLTLMGGMLRRATPAAVEKSRPERSATFSSNVSSERRAVKSLSSTCDPIVILEKNVENLESIEVGGVQCRRVYVVIVVVGVFLFVTTGLLFKTDGTWIFNRMTFSNCNVLSRHQNIVKSELPASYPM